MIAIKRLWIVPFVILLSCFSLTTLAHADGLGKTDVQKTHKVDSRNAGISALLLSSGLDPTLITIEPLKPLALGDHPTVVVHLERFDGKPVANEPVYIFVDDIHQNKAMTDSTGTAYAPLLYKFPAKTYQITATYRGSKKLNLLTSTTKTELVVKRSDITLRTVPPIAGIRFAINHQIYTSDENGNVNFSITESGKYRMEVLPIDEKILLPNTKLTFTRWNDSVFDSAREVYLPRPHTLEAGFVYSYKVSQIFLDPDGRPVDPSRVSLLRMSGVGKLYTFEDAGPHWLPANRLIRRIGEHLESQGIPYYIRNITIDGSNVINQSEQRFHIHPNDVLPIKVLVYSAHFSARDAMFRFPIGSGVKLEYPDGHSEEFPFASQGELEVGFLARGSYLATVTGASGSAPSTPMHLSHDQDVELLVLSYLDMAVIFGVPLMIALALLFIGRPYLLKPILQTQSMLKAKASSFFKRQTSTQD